MRTRRTLFWLFLLAVPVQLQAQDSAVVGGGQGQSAQVVRDLPYARYGERELLLDLYLPAEPASGSIPAVVVIRGGGFRVEDKEGFGFLAQALAERALAAASIEYRASPEAPFPAAVLDTKAAVRWIRGNATAYGLDQSATGAIGGSAGAHLAIYLGVTAGIPELEGEGGYPEYKSSVRAVAALAPSTNFREMRGIPVEGAVEEFLGVPFEMDPPLWHHASPMGHVDESSPPLLLLHSEADATVPFMESIRIAERYGEVGRPVEVVLIPGAPHGFWHHSDWFEESMERVARFFWRNLGGSG
jgi:arylsulfatase A